MNASKKNIVLTGASKGIGLAIAKQFVAMGHSVEGCSRSGLDFGTAGFPVSRVDVSDYLQVEEWASGLIDKGHIPDILISNAGLINAPAPLWSIPPEEIKAVVDTNVLGVFYTFKAFLPAMIKRTRGTIVALSSGWGRSTDPEFAPYCASKFAVEGLTSSLAKEVPPEMGVVTLSPGIVQTEMLFRCWGDRALEYELPEDLAARAAPFLLGITPASNGKQLTVPAPESGELSASALPSHQH